MIYTCTLNPSVDYFISLDKLTPGELHRAKHYDYRPGGKGINVSVMLSNLGIRSTVLGFFGGYQGKAIIDALQQYPLVDPLPTWVAAPTRINVKISAEEETEINAGPPQLDSKEVIELIHQCSQLTPKDTIILSGSPVFQGNDSIYDRIAAVTYKNDVTLVVDTSGEQLRRLLKYRPLLIKPNQSEIEALFHRSAKTQGELVLMARTLISEGAQHVLISQGSRGALLITQNEVYQASAPQGKVVNTIGSGDSLVAGFIATYLATKDLNQALRYGIACGSASAFVSGIAIRSDVEELISDVAIKKVEG